MIIRDLERIETAFESAREHAAATGQPADQARITQGAISESAVLASRYLEGANAGSAGVSPARLAPKAAMRCDPPSPAAPATPLRRTRIRAGGDARATQAFAPSMSERAELPKLRPTYTRFANRANRIAHGYPQSVELATVTTQFKAAKKLARKLAALFDVEGL